MTADANGVHGVATGKSLHLKIDGEVVSLSSIYRLTEFKTAWDTLQRPGGNEPTRELVRIINDELQSTYDSNRYGKWRRGGEPVPVAVQALMRRDVLRYLLGDDVGDALHNILT